MAKIQAGEVDSAWLRCAEPGAPALPDVLLPGDLVAFRGRRHRVVTITGHELAGVPYWNIGCRTPIDDMRDHPSVWLTEFTLIDGRFRKLFRSNRDELEVVGKSPYPTQLEFQL